MLRSVSGRRFIPARAGNTHQLRPPRDRRTGSSPRGRGNTRHLERLGKSEPDEAPALNVRVATVGRGPGRQTAVVPAGIDPGWAYAPGQAAARGPAARRYLESSARRAPGVAAAGVAATLERNAVMEALGDEWGRWRRGGGRGRQAEVFTLGAMAQGTMAWLRGQKGVDVATAAITVTRRELSHATRADKVRRGAALDDDDIDRLPVIVARPDAVLYDNERPEELLYIFEPANDAGRKGKVVVRVNFTDRLAVDGADRASVTSNSVRTAGYVQAGDLPASRYERISGTVE